MSISFSMRFNSSDDGNCPRFLITVPNSSVVIDPSPSLSKSRKASLSSELDESKKKNSELVCKVASIVCV